MAYQSIADPARAEFVEKKSRFIGSIAPVQTKEEAQTFIDAVRKEFPDATHHIFAYLLRDGGVERYSDDGEPQGTAGIPALEVLKREQLTNLCVVVTRYFGGTLLGAGGLVRAYAHGCKIAVDAATRVEYCLCEKIYLRFAYPFYDRIQRLLPTYCAQVEQTDYADKIALRLTLREAWSDSFTSQLIELTKGQIEIETEGKLFTISPQSVSQ